MRTAPWTSSRARGCGERESGERTERRVDRSVNSRANAAEEGNSFISRGRRRGEGSTDARTHPNPLKHGAYPTAANDGGKLLVPTTCVTDAFAWYCGDGREGGSGSIGRSMGTRETPRAARRSVEPTRPARGKRAHLQRRAHGVQPRGIVLDLHHDRPRSAAEASPTCASALQRREGMNRAAVSTVRSRC